MAHFKLFYPSEYLQACDLHEKDVDASIEKIQMEEVPGVDGKKSNKPVLFLKGAKKRFPLPKTCARVIAGAYGNDTDQWVGKRITLFPTTCQAFGQIVECVRVKIPAGKGAPK